jgi:Na+/H+-dicarboxylate symporter
MTTDFVQTYALLYMLAVIDCALASYRSAGARVALIDKGLLGPKSLLRGALLANIPVGVAAATGWLLLQNSAAPQHVLESFSEAGQRMLQVFIPFALFAVFALVVRCIPSVDVLVLGPFTFFRPFVALAGVLYAMLTVRTQEVFIMVIPVIISMLSIQRILDCFSRYPDFEARRRATDS